MASDTTSRNLGRHRSSSIEELNYFDASITIQRFNNLVTAPSKKDARARDARTDTISSGMCMPLHYQPAGRGQLLRLTPHGWRESEGAGVAAVARSIHGKLRDYVWR
jgi:hypothetical protein